MKKIFLFLSICLASYTITAQTTTKCPENFTAENFDEYIAVLEKYKPNLKKVRRWSRENNRQDIVWSTLRLEYWANDMVRYINKNKKDQINNVCKRLFYTDSDTFSDFLNLGFFYQHMPNLAPINHTKYKK